MYNIYKFIKLFFIQKLSNKFIFYSILSYNLFNITLFCFYTHHILSSLLIFLFFYFIFILHFYPKLLTLSTILLVIFITIYHY
jgi:hypothetical protein